MLAFLPLLSNGLSSEHMIVCTEVGVVLAHNNATAIEKRRVEM
jgi:hypothetical protein